MELYWFRREEFNRLYNCSKINIEDIPLESRIHPVKGMIVIILCAIFYILYIPCSFSLFKRRENACYKLMLYICLIDCSALWLLGFLQGWLSNVGAVYCSYPNVLYFAGVSAISLWMTESAAQIFLAVNRCIAILSPNTETFFFKGSRTYFWLTIVTFYGIYVAIFTKPQLYTGIIFSWAFNPYLGYIADTDSTYVNYVHTVHDTSIAIILPSIYVLFYLFLLHKSKGSGSKAVSNKQKMLFIQILIIGFIHLVGCLLYASFTYINYPVEFIYLAQSLWFFAHGIPPIIYLTMNQTIRNDFLRSFTRFKSSRITSMFSKDSVAPISIIKPSSSNSAL